MMTISENKLMKALDVLWRLYLSFIIFDLIDGMSITKAVKIYGIDKSYLQQLLTTVQYFAGTVIILLNNHLYLLYLKIKFI